MYPNCILKEEKLIKLDQNDSLSGPFFWDGGVSPYSQKFDKDKLLELYICNDIIFSKAQDVILASRLCTFIKAAFNRYRGVHIVEFNSDRVCDAKYATKKLTNLFFNIEEAQLALAPERKLTENVTIRTMNVQSLFVPTTQQT